MIETRTQVRVRYAETDQMGFAHHANFLTWFELARIDLLDQVGLPYRQLETDGYFLPVLEVHVEYRQPARFDDRLDIITTVPEKPRLRLRIEYRVERAGELLATGFTTHAFINREEKPIRPPASFLALFG